MTGNDSLSVLWRRKAIVLAMTLLGVVIAVGGLKAITPVYESSSTVAFVAKDPGRNPFLVTDPDPYMSLYARAATARQTKQLARQRLPGGELGDISAATYPGSALMSIRARSTSPRVAAQSAQAVTVALFARIARGQVGFTGLRPQQLDRPVLPTSPVFPSQKLGILVGLLLGLGFGIGAAFLRENMSSRVHTRSELTSAAGAPVYAELPPVKALEKPTPPEVFLSSPELRTVAEGFRELRTNLAFADGGISSIVVTSPEGRHGKTTVATGLAATLARAGLHTVLVDADLRRGRIHQMLGIDQAPGLAEALTSTRLTGLIRRTGVPKLDVLTRGRLLSDSSGELVAAAFPQLLERLEQAYEAVVIDTTPLVGVDDSRMIASLAKQTVIVVAADRTPQSAVREAVERLALVSVNPTATVLNRSKHTAGRTYYGHDSEEPGSNGVDESLVGQAKPAGRE